MRELPDLRNPALAARGRHPILAVYDGSAASKHALAYAAGLARRADRWLVIVRIWRFGVRQAERMRRLRAELADADLGGLDIEIVSRIGDPAGELIRATAEHRADALVIGASRRLTRAPMTVRVMRRAACPAVVVPLKPQSATRRFPVGLTPARMTQHRTAPIPCAPFATPAPPLSPPRPARAHANDIDAPSLLLEQQQCSIDAVWGTNPGGCEG